MIGIGPRGREPWFRRLPLLLPDHGRPGPSGAHAVAAPLCFCLIHCSFVHMSPKPSTSCVSRSDHSFLSHPSMEMSCVPFVCFPPFSWHAPGWMKGKGLRRSLRHTHTVVVQKGIDDMFTQHSGHPTTESPWRLAAEECTIPGHPADANPSSWFGFLFYSLKDALPRPGPAQKSHASFPMECNTLKGFLARPNAVAESLIPPQSLPNQPPGLGT